jgi:excisionase family DNA binding protein
MPIKQKELTTAEAAQRLGIRLDYLSMLLRSGKIAGRKHDGRWLVSAVAVSAKINAQKAHGNGR